MTLVPERFYADWKLDTTYSWQQNRGIVGHNLKIVWNLHRVANFLASIDADLSRAASNAADNLLQVRLGTEERSKPTRQYGNWDSACCHNQQS